MLQLLNLCITEALQSFVPDSSLLCLTPLQTHLKGTNCPIEVGKASPLTWLSALTLLPPPFPRPRAFEPPAPQRAEVEHFFYFYLTGGPHLCQWVPLSACTVHIAKGTLHLSRPCFDQWLRSMGRSGRPNSASISALHREIDGSAARRG